jgi:Na+-transporting NADH:ubiquinone oxidoreductase subunit NqrF
MKKATYKVNGYLMSRNPNTYEMERTSFVSNVLVFSRLIEIENNEDREFFECEIALQLKSDYFELNGFQTV